MGKAVSDVDLDEERVVAIFEGSGVTETAVEVRNISGGLNESMETETKVVEIGDSGVCVFRWDCTGVNHKPVKPKAWHADDESHLRRVHVMRATDVTYIDEDLVRDVLDKQRARNIAHAQRKAKAEEIRKGLSRVIPDDGQPTGETARRARGASKAASVSPIRK